MDLTAIYLIALPAALYVARGARSWRGAATACRVLQQVSWYARARC